MLPQQYKWLENETGPKMLIEALKCYGVTEIPGAKSNDIIMLWAKELGIEKQYTNDDTAWCGMFMALIAKRAGKVLPFTYIQSLWARNWAKFGTKTASPELGDVLVFVRNGGGHVALYVGEDSDCYHCLGGNQGNKVSITRIKKSRLFQACSTPYNVKPTNVRKVLLGSSGEISTNEG